MINDPSGAKVHWDHQLGTFVGIYGDLRVGKFGGDILTISDLETRLGVSLSAATGAALQDYYHDQPYLANKQFVSKLQFMDLFRPLDLEAIYTAAKTTVSVQIELDRVNRAPDGKIELTDPRTLAGLQKMEANGLIQPGDAERISKGIKWVP